MQLAQQTFGNCRGSSTPPQLPPYALHTLELTLHGYGRRRRFGWARAEEYVLSSSRPPFWQRWRGAAPLLALTIRIEQDGSHLRLARAPAEASASRMALFWRLPPAAQQQLRELHEAIQKN
ncbi:hypothetical protein [Massilia sp. NR 4-1]|uniref:hypothetical protein n=1 Tax=Massilia sp. NR 4-1 TaxID=1678028 RepID=UPI00067D4E90|nr:hypothetical protein [Massilia sp. NR 4-1]AKU23444.1 hypothetical protein ACZ75_20265 [Massilia sp. NR 4-1]